MTYIELKVVHETGEIAQSIQGEEEVCLAYNKAYEEGDRVILTSSKKDCYFVVQVDDALGEAFVYLTKSEICYNIPFGEKKISYSPKCFSGDRHLLTARVATKEEIAGFRNLALNVMDQHGDTGCYPHAVANVETRGESVFAARNAIDGVKANASHGEWPFESWGINRQDDATIRIEFGREVEISRLVLYTRADFPHDNWWKCVTVSFSDGTSFKWSLEKSDKAHKRDIESKKARWITLSELIKADDPSPFPALTQIEVYGKN